MESASGAGIPQGAVTDSTQRVFYGSLGTRKPLPSTEVRHSDAGNAVRATDTTNMVFPGRACNLLCCYGRPSRWLNSRLCNFVFFCTDAAVGRTPNAVPAKARAVIIVAVLSQNGKKLSARVTKIVPKHHSAMEIKLSVQYLLLRRITWQNAMKELRCACSKFFLQIRRMN